MPVEQSVWRNSAFQRLVGADFLSQFGTQVTLVALPLTALLVLNAGPFQLGLLTAAEMAAFLVIGLPAGVWADRMRRRPILVAADAVRALALLSVPLAAFAGVLSLVQLYVVALVVGVGTVFFDVAHMSFVPSIVRKDDLSRGIGTLETLRSGAWLAGPGLGGWLVQVLTAPFALLADAISYACSALILSTIRAEETPAAQEERGSLKAEVAEGLRYVLGHPVLRRVAMVGALNMLTNGLWSIVQPLFLVRELGLGAGVYGLIVSAMGVGGVVGGAIAPKIVDRYGNGGAMYGGALLAGLFPLIGGFTAEGWRVLLYPLGLALLMVAAVVFNVAQGSYRQAVTPDHLRGRMNASMRFLMWSAMPIGGVLGGLLAEQVSVGQLLWVACLGTAAAHLPIIVSPWIRRLRVEAA
ncbi:MFS transporter [Nonomuraea sp. NPDC049152]|uniref:MFS transporter n=1 Tax=Nonomuraea sp. NPDC049152 TaxID=3154350 RepID=UPI0033E18635